MTWRRLEDRAAWAWIQYAPAVLAMGGEPCLEVVALRRPGVAAAKALYDETLRAIHARDAFTAAAILEGLRDDHL